MNFRNCPFLWLAAFILCSGPAARSAPVVPPAENLLHLHWLGLNQISANTNAAQFMAVWQLPQTTALVAQTLDKLSRWPGHGATNAASRSLRPLLDDLVSSEFYLEVYFQTNSQLASSSSLSAHGGQSGTDEGRDEVGSANSQFTIHNSQFLLAIRLSADRSRLWQTNLAALPQHIEISRAGDWTLVGVGLDKSIAQTDFAARLATAASRFSSSARPWLEADFNPSHLTPALSPRPTGGEGRGEVGSSLSNGGEGRGEVGKLLSPFNHLHLTLSGEGGYVFTRGTLDFSAPFDGPLPAWEIPTNLIHSPLTSFTAVRGIAPWLAASPAWHKLALAPAPDQAYLWAQVQQGGPFVTYFAAPLPAASNQLSQLAVRLVQNANPWLATNGQGSFQWYASPPGIVWNDAFIISPFLKPMVVNRHDYVLGGLVSFIVGNPNPMPVEQIRAVLGTANLVYYQAERTGSRVEDDFFITQLFRVVFHQSQMPPKATGTQWLKNVEPLLGDSTTFVTRTGPEQLALTRFSTIGFTALELHLLADWLESPQFPRGIHTFLAPPDKTP